MSSDGPSFLQRRLRGALIGLGAGLLLVLLEAAVVWLPALAGTDLGRDLAPPLAAGIMAGTLGCLGGLVHPALAVAALLVAAPLGSPTPAVTAGLVLVVAAVAFAMHRRPWLSAPVLLCFVGLVAWLQPPAAPPRPAQERPDIVFLVMDTVSAAFVDPTHSSVAPSGVAPNLLALADDGTLFTRAIAAAPWTVPSHAAMFTGRLPLDAGAHHEHTSLPDGVPTTAALLADSGYRTGAFTANPWVGRFNGLTRGFQHEEAEWQRGRANRAFSLLGHVPGRPSKGGERVVTEALAFLDHSGDAPAMVFLNVLEAHSPFHVVPDPTRFVASAHHDRAVEIGERTHQVQMAGVESVPGYPDDVDLRVTHGLYASAVGAADDLLGALVAGLEARGRLDDTVIVVTSDHGEAFGEHGFHGHMVGSHTPTLHVPLVIRAPGTPPTRVDTPVSTARLHPTLLALAGLPAPDDAVQVGPALPLGTREEAPTPVVSTQLRPLQVVADMKRAGAASDLGALDQRAVRIEHDGLSLVLQEHAETGVRRYALYDVQDDPWERKDRWADRASALTADQLAAVETLKARADAVAERWQTLQAVAPSLDSDLRAELEALGYLAEE